MSGDVLLSDQGGTASRLITALATLTAQLTPGTFAVVGGLAVMARLRTVHRSTDDIDGVSQQIGDDPSEVAIVLGVSGRTGVRRAVAGVAVDHIDVGDTPAILIPVADLPTDEWDRAFVLAHRWGLDAASSVTIRAISAQVTTAAVTCLAASPASLVTMKLQSAPRRPPARVDKAANDYADLYRLLSNVELLPEIAVDLATGAPHDLGSWALRQIRAVFIERADNTARAARRSGLAEPPTATDVEAAGTALIGRVETAGTERAIDLHGDS